jgi:hypothetical protein
MKKLFLVAGLLAVLLGPGPPGGGKGDECPGTAPGLTQQPLACASPQAANGNTPCGQPNCRNPRCKGASCRCDSKVKECCGECTRGKECGSCECGCGTRIADGRQLHPSPAPALGAALVPDNNPCSRGRDCIDTGKTCNGRRGSCHDNGCGCETSVAARSRRLPDARLAGVVGGCCCGSKGCCRVPVPLSAWPGLTGSEECPIFGSSRCETFLKGQKCAKKTVTVKGQLHQPHVFRGKCGDSDCAGPGSERCAGDHNKCGDPGSCPEGNCISKKQSCCCRRAGPEGSLATAETSRRGIRGDKGCCRVAGSWTGLAKQRKCARDCGRPCHDDKSKRRNDQCGCHTIVADHRQPPALTTSTATTVLVPTVALLLPLTATGRCTAGEAQGSCGDPKCINKNTHCSRCRGNGCECWD